jgi:hypothetical protein
MLNRIRSRFDAMPRLLQVTATASIVLGLLCIVEPFVPAAQFDLAGHKLSHSEIWDTRVAFALLLVGPIMLLVGGAVVIGRRWVRPLLVLLPVLQTLPFLAVHWLFGAPNPVGDRFGWIVWIVGSTLWALAAMAYLFRARGPLQYFA